MNIFQEYGSLLNNVIIQIVSAITILILGLLIGRFVGKLSYKILNELEIDDILTKRLGSVVDIEKYIGKLLQLSVYVISIFYAFRVLGLPLTSLYYVLLLVVFLVLIFIILEIKDYVYNLFIGMFLINKSFLTIGQRLKVKDIEGQIVKMSNTEIKILSDDKDTFFIPNAVLMKSSLFNKKKGN